MDSFVQRRGTQLIRGGRPWYANGFNAYWLMYCASIPEQRDYVTKALCHARDTGLSVCRTWAFYDGPGWHALQVQPGRYEEATFQALDWVVATAGSMGIHLILTLANNWADYGGKPQYVAWRKEGGASLPDDDSAFFSDPVCREWFRAHAQAVLLRRNTVSGMVYRDDATILAWELMNEPRISCDPSGDVLHAWILEMAAHVKTLDSRHLVSIGTEGFYGPSSPERLSLNAEEWMERAGTDFLRNHRVPGVDLASVHAYVDSRSLEATWSGRVNYYTQYLQGHINDSDKVLKMPLLVGEFAPERKGTPFGCAEKREEVYEATYSMLARSARAGGAAAVACYWHLLVHELSSWDDGYAKFENVP